MKTSAAAAMLFLVFPAAAARAEWHAGPGVAIVRNINDVLDVYEESLRAQQDTVDVTKRIPIGIAFDVHNQYDTGLRVGFGLGPYFRLTGDASHFELPLNGTVGYTFAPENNTSPYVKGGLVYHFASGDFHSKSELGPLAGVGLELGRSSDLNFTIELSIDRSKVELNTVCGPLSSAGCTPGTTSLHSYDTVVSFFVKF
jgi:hypothetical protein